MAPVNHASQDIPWRSIIRWVATFLFVTPIGIIFAANVEKLAQEKKWDTFLTNWWPAMLELSPLLESSWFWFVFGIITATAVLLWVDKLMRGPRIDKAVLTDESIRKISSGVLTAKQLIAPAPITIEFNPENETYFNQERRENPDVSVLPELYREYYCTVFNNSDETLRNVSCEVDKIITSSDRPTDRQIDPETIHEKLHFDLPTFPTKSDFAPREREKLWLFSRLKKALDNERICIVKGTKSFHDMRRQRKVFLKVTAENYLPKSFSVDVWVHDGIVRMTHIRPETES